MAINLPVAEIVTESVNRVFKNLPQVIAVGLLPLIVFFAITLFGSLLAILARTSAIAMLATMLAYGALGFFALAWMRVVLNGYQGDASRARLALGAGDQKFWGYYLLLLVPALLLGLIGLSLPGGSLTGTLVSLFLVLVVVALCSTVQLAFPAAAIGEPTNLDKAWQQGMHVLGPMVGINLVLALIVGIPIVIVDYALNQLAIQLYASLGMGGLILVVVIANIVFAPIYLIGMALFSTAVCLVYRRVVSATAVS
jgi:hypothetical protein